MADVADPAGTAHPDTGDPSAADPVSDLGEPLGEAPSRRRRVAPWIALGVAVLLAGLVVLAAGGSGGDNETADTPLLGQAAPVVRTTTIDGESFDLSSRRGSWVVLNFFGTWCPPCRREHPELVRFADAQEAQGTGVELYTVINNDDAGTVRAFYEENGGDWPVLRDDDGGIAIDFGVAKVPETWIIDPDGVVRLRVISEVTAEGLTSLVEQVRAQDGR
jgi:cytochrome c biogenesis protein CcmG/thiol:disulfide interchange protein DsbE